MWRFIFVLTGMSAAAGVALAGSALTVEAISNPAGVRISVQPSSPAGWSLLQIVDPNTGACLKTVHAGRLARPANFVVVPDSILPPGSYRLRYREGIDLVLAEQIARPDEKMPTWLSPADLVLVGPWVYIFDAGEKVEPAGDSPEQQEAVAVRQPCIFKIDRQGKLDTAFGENGRMAMPGVYTLHAFAVDPLTGKLFISRLGHEVSVFEPNGSPTEQTIGGWDGDPRGPKCTAWCNSVALGFENRIYIPAQGYGIGKVYDRNKKGFEGILYAFEIPDVNGFGRMICSDMNGAVYLTGQSRRITRYTDDGTSVKAAYQSAEDVRLAVPTGGSTSAGLVWWASHGPGFGPYWDSGGGGEIVLFWDTGKELQLIARYGIPGTAADRLEFLNPSATIMDLTHSELWVTEDGQPNKEGPRGNARVRRFELKARYTEDMDFELPKAP